eukprot:SM000052S17724  [mRNA]  locus=s52:295919:301090:- [translate_table: standard]
MAASAGYIVAPVTTGKVALAAFLVGVFVGYHLKGTISRGVERLLRRYSAHDLCGHHRLAESVERLLVVLVRAVREVEASHIHPGAQELLEDGDIAGLGPEGADDLGLGDCLR